MDSYQFFKLSLAHKVAHVQLNRPEKLNAMNQAFWTEIKQIFAWIAETPEVRAVVISGEGKHFSAGIDLQMFAGFAAKFAKDAGRNARLLRATIQDLQSSLSAVENCSKPVLAAIHGYCIGGAVDLIAACDMRYCAADAVFSIKEVDIGMAADVGTLQRLPHIIGDGVMRELAYTARDFDATEAKQIGLVNQVYPDHATLLEQVLALAATIASKSPIAIEGTKEMIRYARDHSVADGLNYIATWNAAMLQVDDLKQAMAAQMMKQQPEFKD